MDVLVTGGTGFVGSRVCAELDGRGHDVTALARSPGEADADLPAGVATVRGDVTDLESVTEAADGMDVLVNLVALSPLTRPKGGERMHDVVHRAGTENCVAAAEAGGVERIVQMSGIHAAPDAPTAYLRAKGRAEEAVREADPEHVILRPTTAFGDGDELVPFVKLVAPPYLTPLPGGGKTRFQLIWVDDLAAITADAIEGEEHAGETYEIGGPDVLTLADIARMVHAADGRSAGVVPIPMFVAGLGMRIGGLIPGFPLGPNQYEGLKMDLVARDDLDAFDVDPDELRTFADYLGVG